MESSNNLICYQIYFYFPTYNCSNFYTFYFYPGLFYLLNGQKLKVRKKKETTWIGWRRAAPGGGCSHIITIEDNVTVGWSYRRPGGSGEEGAPLIHLLVRLHSPRCHILPLLFLVRILPLGKVSVLRDLFFLDNPPSVTTCSILR